jgi:hypothetical protein
MDDVECASCRFQNGRDGHNGHEKPTLVHNSYTGESTSPRASAAPRGVTSPCCWNWVTRRDHLRHELSLKRAFSIRSGDKCGAFLLGTAAVTTVGTRYRGRVAPPGLRGGGDGGPSAVGIFVGSDDSRRDPSPEHRVELPRLARTRWEWRLRPASTAAGAGPTGSHRALMHRASTRTRFARVAPRRHCGHG